MDDELYLYRWDLCIPDMLGIHYNYNDEGWIETTDKEIEEYSKKNIYDNIEPAKHCSFDIFFSDINFRKQCPVEEIENEFCYRFLNACNMKELIQKLFEGWQEEVIEEQVIKKKVIEKVKEEPEQPTKKITRKELEEECKKRGINIFDKKKKKKKNMKELREELGK